MIRAHNPTARGKAVRDVDGLTIIKPGATVSISVEWTDVEIARYIAAEVVIEADDDREGAIRAAIAGLEPADFTKSGKPEVDAINLLMPEGGDLVTASERDAIWKSMG